MLPLWIWVWDHLLENEEPMSSHTIGEKMTLPPPAANSSLDSGGSSWAPPSSMLASLELSTPILWLLHRFWFFFCSPNMVTRIDANIPFRTEPSVNYFYCHESWVSTLTAAHFHQTILWQKLNAAQICGHRHKYLEASLITWPLSKP